MKRITFLFSLLIASSLSVGSVQAQPTTASSPTPAPAPTATPAPASKSKSTMPENQKPSYSLGLFMGEQIRMSLQTQGIDVNQEAFSKGLTDGATGATPALTVEEAQAGLNMLQQAAQSKVDSKVRGLAVAHAGELFGPTQTIVSGNPQGTVTLVEFSDYECPHCKAMTPIIEDLIEKNPNLRVIHRPFPIINANSTNAAIAAFAAAQQGRFNEVNSAFMTTQRPLTDDEIRKIIKLTPKLDSKKYEIAIKGSRIKEELKNNRELGLAIGIRGTPSLLIAKTVTNMDDQQTWPDAAHIYFTSGEVSEAGLTDLIHKAAE